MITVIDNQMGNIKSVSNALTYLGVKHIITTSPDDISHSSGVILPGVGNFSQASKRLIESGFYQAIVEHAAMAKPILGICLGMQLLFNGGSEGGGSLGLQLIPGTVNNLADRINGLPLPHIGWNDLALKPSRIFAGITSGDCFYFVHGYEVLTNEEYIVAKTDYSVDIVAVVEKNNIFGVQFHPEKSQKLGLEILKNFVKLC